jgi:hypothetical protein
MPTHFSLFYISFSHVSSSSYDMHVSYLSFSRARSLPRSHETHTHARSLPRARETHTLARYHSGTPQRPTLSYS